MKITTRKEFIKYLVDCGCDVNSSPSGIEGYYDGELLFKVSDLYMFGIQVNGNLGKLQAAGVDIERFYERITNYATIEIELRFKALGDDND